MRTGLIWLILLSGVMTLHARAGEQRLGVGSTGIMCIKRPCPSRGVFTPGGGALAERRRALLYTDLDGQSDLPEIIGTPSMQAALREAWANMACLEVVGRFERRSEARPRLYVSRLLGRCGRQR